MYDRLYYKLPNSDAYIEKLLGLSSNRSKYKVDENSKNFPSQLDLRLNRENLFIEMKPDKQLFDFLNLKSSWWSQIKRSFYIRYLKYNLTSADALTGCGKMYLLGKRQFYYLVSKDLEIKKLFTTYFQNLFQELESSLSIKVVPSNSNIQLNYNKLVEENNINNLINENINKDFNQYRWLDIGTGDASILNQFLPSWFLKERLTAVEVNNEMIQILKNQCNLIFNFENDLIENIENIKDKVQWDLYKVISLFNVLDRCYTPKSLLQSIHRLMNKDHIFFLSVVFPFAPFVELDDGTQDIPDEILMPTFDSFCQSAYYLIEQVLSSMFHVVSWSRIPYCCQGDTIQDYYALDSIVLVCIKKDY